MPRAAISSRSHPAVAIDDETPELAYPGHSVPEQGTPTLASAVRAARMGGNSSHVPSASLLRHADLNTVRTGNLHDLAELSVRGLAAALGCSSRAGNRIGEEVAELLNKAFLFAIDSGASPYANLNARQLRWRFPRLSEEDACTLQQAMEATHVRIGAASLAINTRLAVFFDGAQNPADSGGDFNAAPDLRGEAVYQAAGDVARILAKVLSGADAPARLELLSGFSPGGRAAQYFRAVLQSEGNVQTKFATVLFDPRLLDAMRERDALRDAMRTYRFDALQGIALPLQS